MKKYLILGAATFLGVGVATGVISLLLATIILVLTAELINGWTDAPNAIATVVVTRSIPIWLAIPAAGILNAAGAFMGTEVAMTVGKGIVEANVISLKSIGGAMVAVINWGMLAAHFGWPISKSHALLAGIAGAGVYMGGFGALIAAGWIKVGWGMVASIAAGFIVTLLVCWVLMILLHRAPNSFRLKIFGFGTITVNVDKIVDAFHGIAACVMSLAHGRNDGQKFIGILALVMYTHLKESGVSTAEFTIPYWIIIVCSLTMGIGTAMGGWKIIGTIGRKIGNLESWQGLAAASSASATIMVASDYGVPLSTTHTITSSITGSIASRRFGDVQWAIAGRIAFAWLTTFPSCFVFGFIGAFVADHVF